MFTVAAYVLKQSSINGSSPKPQQQALKIILKFLMKNNSKAHSVIHESSYLSWGTCILDGGGQYLICVKYQHYTQRRVAYFLTCLWCKMQYVYVHLVKNNFVFNLGRNLSSLPIPLATAKHVDSSAQQQGQSQCFLAWRLQRPFSVAASSRLSLETEPAPLLHPLEAFLWEYVWSCGGLSLTYSPGSFWDLAEGKLCPWGFEPTPSYHGAFGDEREHSPQCRHSTTPL